MIEQEITLENDKYKYTRYTNGKQIISRYNEEEWLNATGDNFLMAMAQRVARLENELENARNSIVGNIEE